MAEKILRQNKVPGCERLTRPEEIKALSKYLRNIKENLEENTDLEETTLEIPGKTTGKFHDISELPDDVYGVDNNSNSIESLYDSVIGIEDNRENELSDYKEKLEDNREPELSDFRDNLEDTREQELSEYRDNIEDNREISLSDFKDSIEDNRTTNLSDFRDNLEDTREINLDDYKDTIEDSRNSSLSDYKDIIEDTRETNLSDYVETISDIPEPELPNIAEELGGESKVISSLPDFKDTIVDNKDNSLEDYKDTLIDTRDPELPNYKDTIEDLRDNELEDTKLDIFDDRESSLSDTLINISDTRDTSLQDTRIDIHDDRNTELEDLKLNISDNRENTLEDYRDDLVNEHENSLSDIAINLEDPRELTLEDYKNELVSGDFKDPQKPIDNLSLNFGDFKDPQKPTDNLDLDFGEFKEPSLYDYVINLGEENYYNPNNNTNTLSTDGVARIDGEYRYSFDNPELEDVVIPVQYGPGENPRIDEDYDYIDNSIGLSEADPIIQLKARNKFERHQTLVNRPDNIEEEARIDGIYSNNEWNTDGSPGYYGSSFDDVVPKIEGINEVESLYDAVLERPDDNSSDSEHNYLGDVSKLSEKELYDLILTLAYDKSSDLDVSDEWREKIASLVSTYLNPGDENKPISPRNAHRFEDELYRSIRLVESAESINGSLSRNSDGTARVDGEYDFIDNNPTSEISEQTEEERIKEHTSEVYKDIPFMQIPEDSTIFDKAEYIRYAAEKIVGWTGTNNERLRKFLLTETLWALVLARRGVEKTTGINRDRLPGRQGGVGTAIDDINTLYNAFQNGNLTNSVIGLLAKYLKEKPNPINRPEVDELGRLKKEGTTDFELGNNRYEANREKGVAGSLENLWNNIESIANGGYNYSRPYSFKDNYLKGGGIATTLSDLCEGKTSDSVEGLLEIFKNSPYITTPAQFGTIHEGSYGTQTLDSNSYWEVIIEPLCNNYLNGGYSYLPCFDEINVINYSTHGVRTAYNRWVPISNFELQKAKLTTKSIGLYDGEFSFPVSAELTNEIRFTIVDDQYKSWRNYFQKCMDVAVYNSEPHGEYYYRHEYYEGNPLSNNGKSFVDYIQNSTDYISSRVTAVDKSIITVAFYKNITFRIRIYIMTPQYSTIRRFDLLCVLKDFIEEYSGDVDSGGVDLNVTFSIVGENPNGADQDNIRDDYYTELINSGYTESQISIPEEIIDEDEWYLNSSQINLFE